MRFVFPSFVIALLLIFLAFVVTTNTSGTYDVATSTIPSSSSTNVSPTQVASSTSLIATSTAKNLISTSTTISTTTPKKQASKPKNQPSVSTSQAVSLEPIQPPYTIPPLPFETIDTETRAALVNILCMPQGGTLRPISGSGVIIDPRGIILTNAHVAQYVLLSESSGINLTCAIRTGSPAYPHWKATVLYIPPTWVDLHYKEINSDHIVGTGEHDYALLLITRDAQGNPISTSLPYLPIDARQNITSVGNPVLGAGYPAEFVGGIVAQQGLFAVTSISSVKQLLTFETTTVDVFSVGGVIEAQGGSSGGPVVNAWHYVVGIITTTSDGATTAERDLHALSLDYINRDISVQTGQTLKNILSRNVEDEAQDFSQNIATVLIQKYLTYLTR